RADRRESGVEVEVRRGRGGLHVARLGDVDPGGVPDVEVAGLGVDQPDVVLGVAGGVVRLQAPPAAQVDCAGVLDGPDARRVRRLQLAEQRVEGVPVHHAGAAHQPRRVGQVPGALLVDDDLRLRIHAGDVADAARVVEVDVRDHHGGEVVGADAELPQR